MMENERVRGWPLLLVWLGILGSGVAFWLALVAWVLG